LGTSWIRRGRIEAAKNRAGAACLPGISTLTRQIGQMWKAQRVPNFAISSHALDRLRQLKIIPSAQRGILLRIIIDQFYLLSRSALERLRPSRWATIGEGRPWTRC